MIRLSIAKFRCILFCRSDDSFINIRSIVSFTPAKTLSFSIFLLALGFFGNAQTNVGGEQGDSTWTKAKSPYAIIGNVTVSAGRTLTIEPGVIVNFSSAYATQLTVQGTLKAVGTAADSIMFNNVSGGFTGTGPVTIGASSLKSELRYLRVSGLTNTSAINVLSSSTIIDHCTIANSSGVGITVTNAVALISNNKFVNNKGLDIVLGFDNLSELKGNNDGLRLGLTAQAMTRDTILTSNNIYYLTTNIAIPAGRTLTIEPGVIVNFSSAYATQFTVQGTLKAVGTAADSIMFNNVSGGFNGTGPVTIGASSLNSELRYLKVSGLTNTSAINVLSSSTIIDHCSIANSSGVGITVTNAVALISNNKFVNNKGLDIVLGFDNLSELKGNNDGLRLGLTAQAMTRDTILTSNNIYYLTTNIAIPAGRTLTIEPGVIVNFSSAYATQFTVQGTLKANGTVADSIMFNNVSGGFNSTGPVTIGASSINSELRYVRVNGLTNTSVINVLSSSTIIDHCLIANSSGNGITVTNAVALISNNEFVNNKGLDIVLGFDNLSELKGNNDGLRLGLTAQTMTRDTTLTSNNIYYLTTNIAIPAGRTLTIEHGVMVNFSSAYATQLTVQGTLKANGTVADSIMFNNVSGGFNGTGPVTISASSANSELRYVKVNGLSASSAINILSSSTIIDHCTIANSSNSGITVTNSSINITQSIFENNKIGILSSGGHSTIRACSFTGNTSFGIDNASVNSSDTVDARNCWWGAASGPKYILNPTGTGDAISDRVKYSPFDTSETVFENKALSFDGINGYVNLSSSAVNNLSQGTFETWIYLKSLDQEPILSKQNNSVNTYSVLSIGSYSSPQAGGSTTGTPGIIYFHSKDFTNHNLVSKTPLLSDVWYHVAITFNTDSAVVYINGKADSTSKFDYSIPNDLSSSNITRLGSWGGDGAGFLNGSIDEFRIWNFVRTSAQIDSDMCANVSPGTPGLILYYKMNESDTSSVIIDSSSSHLNGTLSSAPDNPMFVPSTIAGCPANQNSPQSISFTPINDKTFGDTAFAINAVASSGLPVKFKIISGLAKVSGDTLTIMGAGKIKVEADQAGNDIYDPAQLVIDSFTVFKADQEIVFTATLDSLSKSIRYILSASSSTGLPVSFSIQSGYGLITVDSLTFNGSGEVVVRATQPGNQNYASVYKEIIFCITSSQPGAIKGFTTSCIGTQAYSVAPLPGVTFNWSISEGGTIPQPNGNAVSVNWTELGTHVLTVTSSNNCDSVKLSQALTVDIVNSSIPSPPDNLFPPNGTVIRDIPFSFSWQPTINALLYDLYIWPEGTDEPLKAAVENINGIVYGIQSNQIPGFSEGATFNWAVKARNGCAETQSTIQNFTVSNLPNFVVSQVNVADSVFSGTRIDISALVKNIGKADTRNGQWTDEFWLSADSVIDGAFGTDVYMGSRGNISALNTGQSYTTNLSAQLPKDKVGKYYVIVRTNHTQSTLTESNPNDNTNLKGFYINPSPTADLVVDSVLYRADAFSGDSININFKVRNAGQNKTEDSTWRDDIYISPNATFDINEAIKLGSLTRKGSLNPGDSYNATMAITIPTRMFGTYYFYVYTDAGERIYEYLFDNNNITAGNPINIILTAPPDFVVSQLNAPRNAVSGETISIDYTVLNQGANKPGRLESSWVDAVVFSADSLFDRNNIIKQDNYKITNLQPTLGQGKSYSNTVNFTIPPSFSGKGYLYVYTDYKQDVFEYLNEGNNYTRVPITVLNPDLVITNASITGQPSSGGTVDIDWTIKNSGNGRVLPVQRTDAVWLLPTSIFNGAGSTLLQTITYNSSMDTGSSVAQHASAGLPQNIFGKYYLFIQTDFRNAVAESNEANNISDTIPITIIQSAPVDLVVDTVQVSSDTLHAGTVYNLHYSVSNTGTGTIIGQSWTDRIYRSTQPVLNSSAEILQDIVETKTLSPNNSYDETVPISVSLTDFGNQDTLRWYYFVVTDVGNTVYEFNAENNNTGISKQIIITHLPYPDLVVTTAAGSDSLNSGKRTSVSGTIDNTGGTAGLSNSWYDAVLFSKDTVPDAKDIIASTKVAVSPFLYSNTYNLNLNFKVPDGLDGDYYMLLVTDYSGANSDKNRSNNYKFVKVKVSNGDTTRIIPVHISLTPSPDLIVNSFNTPNVGYAGQPVWVKFTVSNYGKAMTPASSWRDNIYLSSDNRVDGGDVSLQSYTHAGALDTAASYRDSVLTFLPSGAVGNHYILFKTDGNNAIYENNGEDNNTASSAIFVLQQTPSDLVVTNIAAPAEAFIDDSVIVTWVVKNQGVNPAIGYMRQGIYSSTDSLLDSSDVLLAKPLTQVNLTAPGDTTYTQKIKLTGVSPGRNYFIVRTDLKDNITEDNEENNISSSLKTINISILNLPIDTLTPAVLVNNNELYYKIDIPDSLAGKTLRVSLRGDSTYSANELYIKYGNIPTRITYDFAYSQAISGNQDVIIPTLSKGTYYVLSYGTSSVKTQQSITLLATPVNFEITDINASQGGNTGNVTVKISGARFEDGMTAILRNNTSGSITAQKITLINSLSLFATFSLNQVDTGKYDVVLVKSNQVTASLRRGFTIVPGSGGLTSGGNSGNGFYCYIKNDADNLLSTQVDYPGKVRVGRPFPMTIIFGNTGNVDIPIPQIMLNSLDNAPIGLTTQFVQGLVNLPLLFKEANGPDDVLRPGATGSIKVFSGIPSSFVPCRYQLVQF